MLKNIVCLRAHSGCSQIITRSYEKAESGSVAPAGPDSLPFYDFQRCCYCWYTGHILDLEFILLTKYISNNQWKSKQCKKHLFPTKLHYVWYNFPMQRFIYSMCLYLEPWNQCFQKAEISLVMLMSINMELHFILPSLLINYILYKYKYKTQKFNFNKIWYNVLNGRICIILKIRWNCSQSFKTFKPSL